MKVAEVFSVQLRVCCALLTFLGYSEGIAKGIQLISELNILKPHYDADNVTVTVEWAQREQGIVYCVEVTPDMLTGNFTESTRYQLTIPYNEAYNFSVMATTPNNVTAFKYITLHYAKCQHPQDLFSAESNVSVTRIIGPNGFPIEDSTARFSCPQGSELIGSSSAHCTENGEWEPDLSQLMCNYSQDVMSADSEVQIIIIIGASSAVAVTLVLCITMVMIAAILSHRRGFRRRKQHTEYVQSNQVTAKDMHADQRGQRPPVYVDVSLPLKHKKRELTLTQTHDFDVEYSVINHDLIVHHHKHVEQPSEGESPDVSLDKLLLLLREQVSPKWREFGDALGISELVLDSISSACSPENYFVDLLDYWLKYCDGKPTWSDVANVLYNIDLHELAQDIENVYESGKLPNDHSEAYVNVTLSSALPQVKLSAKTSQVRLCRQATDAPLGPYNDSENCHKFPPTASKPKFVEATAAVTQ